MLDNESSSIIWFPVKMLFAFRARTRVVWMQRHPIYICKRASVYYISNINHLHMMWTQQIFQSQSGVWLQECFARQKWPNEKIDYGTWRLLSHLYVLLHQSFLLHTASGKSSHFVEELDKSLGQAFKVTGLCFQNSAAYQYETTLNSNWHLLLIQHVRQFV